MTPFLRKFRKSLPVIIFIIIFALLMLLSFFIIQNNNQIYNERQYIAMVKLSERYTITMYQNSMKYLTKVFSLRSLVQRGNLYTEDFYHQLDILKSPLVTGFTFSSLGIINNVYPKEGNDWQINLNYQMSFPDKIDLQQLIMIDNPFLIGPYTTPSGEQEIAAILPVNYFDENGQSHFQGTVSINVKFPEVYEEINLSDINKEGFALRIWKENPISGKTQIIFDTDISVDNAPAKSAMTFSKEFFATTWNFTFVPLKTFFESSDFYTTAILLIIGCFLFSFFGYIFTKSIQAQEKQKLYQIQDKLLQIQEHTIFSLSNLVENRDSDTGNHVRRTSNYVELIAKKAQECGYNSDILTDQYIEILRKAAPMHDIGKIIVPDSVLKKEGKLTPEEFEQIKRHTTEGGRIIQEIIAPVQTKEYTQVAVEIATSHHERWDGKGYPYGFSAENIPLSARIMALADVFDALTTVRCYKAQMPFNQAIEIIEAGKGTQFDPTLTEIFLQNQSELQLLLSKSTIN